MIIKSEEFDKQLNDNIFQITPNKDYPLQIKGSYKFKPFGSLITDIDFVCNVLFNEKLFKIAIPAMLSRINRYNNFLFIDISCGYYKDFKLPWKVMKTGCEFDYDKTIKWYNNIKSKKIISESSTKYIDSIIYKDALTINDLYDIRNELEPYFDIKWTIQDIYNGFIIDKYDKITRYDLLELVKTEQCVLKIVFIYYMDSYGNKDYVSIDLPLIDIHYTDKLERDIYHYSENWYKVFKEYKWRVKEEYREEYTKSLLKIDYKNVLVNRIKLFKKCIKHNILSPNDLKYFENKLLSEIIDKKSGLSKQELIDNGFTDTFSKYNLDGIKLILSKNINNELKDDIIYFIDKLIDKEKIIEQMNIYRFLTLGKIPVNIDILRKRREMGIKCPFYKLDDNEYEFLYLKAIDLLINPIKFVDCFTDICNEYEILVRDIVNLSRNDIVLKLNNENTEIIDIYKRIYEQYYHKHKKMKMTRESLNKIYEIPINKLNYFQKKLVNNIFYSI